MRHLPLIHSARALVGGVALVAIASASCTSPTRAEAIRDQAGGGALLALLDETGVLERAATSGGVTLLIPPPGALDAPLARAGDDHAARVALAANHVLLGPLALDDLVRRRTLVTLDGRVLYLTADPADQGIRLGPASLVEPDAARFDGPPPGVVHRIDRAINLGPRPTLYARIAADPAMPRIATLLRATGLDARLSSPGPYTALLPTDRAIAHLPDDLRAAVNRLAPAAPAPAQPTGATTHPGSPAEETADRAAVRNLLARHIVPGRWQVSDWADAPSAPTLAGDSQIHSAVAPEQSVVVLRATRLGTAAPALDDPQRGVLALIADVPAPNGVLHILDRFLPSAPVPPTPGTSPAPPDAPDPGASGSEPGSGGD